MLGIQQLIIFSGKGGGCSNNWMVRIIRITTVAGFTSHFLSKKKQHFIIPLHPIAAKYAHEISCPLHPIAAKCARTSLPLFIVIAAPFSTWG